MSALVLILLIVALLIGGLGLLIEGLFWLVIIGLVLLVVSAVLGFGRRSTA